VALAASLLPAALGVDTGGSVATPLQCARSRTCGLISHHSVFPLATSLDHVGPMAGTVRDKAMVGHSVHNPTKSSETIEYPLSAKSLRSLTPAIPFQRSPYAHNMLILLGSALDEPLSGLVGSPT